MFGCNNLKGRMDKRFCNECAPYMKLVGGDTNPLSSAQEFVCGCKDADKLFLIGCKKHQDLHDKNKLR